MASTSSTTLSPLVAGAADLARKLAAYKATSNRANQEGREEHPGVESLSPLDVRVFGSQKFFFTIQILVLALFDIYIWDPKFNNLLWHSGGEQLAEGSAGEDGGGPGQLPGEGLPPRAALDSADPLPPEPGYGVLEAVLPQEDAGRALLVGPVNKLLNY